MSQAGQGEAQLGEAADAGSLVVQALALGAGDQLKQLLRLGREEARISPGAGPTREGGPLGRSRSGSRSPTLGATLRMSGALPGGSGAGRLGAELDGSGAGPPGLSVCLWVGVASLVSHDTTLELWEEV